VNPARSLDLKTAKRRGAGLRLRGRQRVEPRLARGGEEATFAGPFPGKQRVHIHDVINPDDL
jgi:hypothetical protein